jgi:hypothetical protein
MWNPSLIQGEPLSVHTVKARWGSRPGTIHTGKGEIPWRGYRPDWHVLTIRYDPTNRAYPYFVTGWLPAKGTRDGAEACEPFCWFVPSIDDARYDLTEAVAVIATKR